MPIKPETPSTTYKVDKAALRERLDPIQYQVTQEKGTERPYTNRFYKHYESGVYTCLVCREELFKSETKYHSGSGWPSFYDVIDQSKVKYTADSSGVGANILRIIANPHLIRTEVSCKNCGSHLGHVFKDGPQPTGKRYCVNSSSLDFISSSSTDETDSNETKNKKPEIIEHLATINGCGSDGFCSLKGGRGGGGGGGDSAMRKKMEDMKIKTGGNNQKEHHSVT